MMKNLIQDIRHSFRSLMKRPAFAALAVLALALGIGANSAIFSVVNAVILRSLPYPDPDRIVTFTRQTPNEGLSGIASFEYAALRQQSEAFEQVAAYSTDNYNLTGSDEPERITCAEVSATLFPLLGVSPVRGRAFAEEEDRPGAERVAVINEGFWRRRFGGDEETIGKTLTLDDKPYTIVGIMPDSFRFPQSQEIWLPIALDAEAERKADMWSLVEVVARLKPDATIERAQAEVETVMAGVEAQVPDRSTGARTEIVPLHRQMIGDIRFVLLLLFGAVGFVLAVACANVANLMLARAAEREREIAVRAALGASRWRIIRQLLTESLLIALAGGALGVLFALWGVYLIISGMPADLSQSLPGAERIQVDLYALCFTLAVSILTGILFGLAPALTASRPDLNRSLKEGSKNMSAASGLRSLRGWLVVAEVSLALVLLAGAGLMTKSFIRLLTVDHGYEAKNVLMIRINLPSSRYGRRDHRALEFERQLIERVSSLGGVRSAGVISHAPFAGHSMIAYFSIEGAERPRPGKDSPVPVGSVSEDYFSAAGIPLLGGRAFDARDTDNSQQVVVVNQAFARRFFPREDPIGKRIGFGCKDDLCRTIVGVVGDVRGELDISPRPEIFLPFAQSPTNSMTLMVRADSDPMSLVSAVRHQVRLIDKDQPLSNIETLERRISDSVAERRSIMMLLGVMAALALVLAAVGIYGVMSYTVASRTREIGIRMALGANAAQVLGLVLRHALLLTLTGIAAGLAGALALTHLMESFLYQVSATDPMTLTLIAALLSIVALGACLAPALRATRVDPIEALRNE